MNLPATALRTAAGALAGTGLVTAAVLGVQHPSSASPTTTSAVAATSGAATCRPHRLHAGKAPAALRKDLAAARAKIKDSDAKGVARRHDRREALAAIRKAGLDGKYGADVQQRLEKHQEKAEQRRASLPEKLRADLDALRKTDPGPARRAAAKKIRAGRLDGTYGAEVQQRAKKHQEHRASCRDQRRETRHGKAERGSTTS